MAQGGRRDYLSPVLNEADKLPATEDLTILYERISECLSMFSLYGSGVDEFLTQFLEFRAIDQKYTADLMVKKVFTSIFKPSSRPVFNLLINLDKKIDLERFKEEFPNIDEDRLEAKNPDGTFKFYKAEVDAALQVDLFPSPTEKNAQNIDRGYIFTEMKMFTAPREDKGKSLQNLLQKARLEHYFRLRYIYGVIGVSYLRSAENHAPVGKNDPELQDLGFTPTNILHVALMDVRVLDKYENATKRTEAILSAIQAVQGKIGGMVRYEQKNFKFELTYNILKVIKMSQKIASLENEIQRIKKEAVERIKSIQEKKKKAEEEKKKAEEEKKKAEEEKQKAEEEKQKAEEEKKKAEEEKKKAEEEKKRYREKLKSLGIDPDNI